MSNLTSDIQIIPQALFSSSSTQNAEVGARAVTPDGRVFRYVKAGGTALVPGKLQQASAIVANHQNMAVQAAAAVGATTVSVTLGATAATANQYAGGMLIINDAAGEGHSYKIKSHPAADASATLAVTLEDAVVVALTTSSEACLIANPYSGVIVNPTTPTASPVGVAIYPVAASQFGWIQTKGLVSALADGAITVGLGIAPSQAVAGAVKATATTLDNIGRAFQAGVDTEYRAVFLSLD